MTGPSADAAWRARTAAVWADNTLDDDALVAAIEALAAERAPDDALALFERAGARDAVGREVDAEPLYRAALAAGLSGEDRARATIQLASTIRVLGRADEALELLRAEFAEQPDAPLASAATAFAALALADLGRSREGLAAVLHALAPTLPAYTRSVRAYADDLLTDTREDRR